MHSKKVIKLALLVTLSAMSHETLAANDLDKQTPTVFVDLTGGYSTFKSELVGSNDTSTTVSYGLGVWAGQERNVGIAIRSDQTTVAFQLNDAKIQVGWQDILLRYRWGPLYFGAVMTTSTWLVSRVDAEAETEEAEAKPFLDMIASGYGGNLGLQVPVTRKSSVYLDVTSVSTSKIQEKAILDEAGALAYPDRTVELKSRLDTDVGGLISLTKVIDGIVGFKLRAYSMTVDSEAYKEQQSTTFLGLRLGWLF